LSVYDIMEKFYSVLLVALVSVLVAVFSAAQLLDEAQVAADLKTATINTINAEMAQCTVDVQSEPDDDVKNHILSLITLITSSNNGDGLFKFWNTFLNSTYGPNSGLTPVQQSKVNATWTSCTMAADIANNVSAPVTLADTL